MDITSGIASVSERPGKGVGINREQHGCGT